MPSRVSFLPRVRALRVGLALAMAALGAPAILPASEPVPGTGLAAAPAAESDAPFLALQEIFRRPIGPRGLEYSELATSLAGRTVRMSGYVVRQTAPVPFALLLAPVPVQLHEREYGLAEDLPANAVHVFFPKSALPVVPRVRGPLTVEGVLELGPREEADGRISHVRLRVPTPLSAVLSAQADGRRTGSPVAVAPSAEGTRVAASVPTTPLLPAPGSPVLPGPSSGPWPSSPPPSGPTLGLNPNNP